MELLVGLTDWLPLVDLEPVQLPEAVQVVALVELQERVEELPEIMVVGLAVRLTVGTGATYVQVPGRVH